MCIIMAIKKNWDKWQFFHLLRKLNRGEMASFGVVEFAVFGKQKHMKHMKVHQKSRNMLKINDSFPPKDK